jgi:hypothetical protein
MDIQSILGDLKKEKMETASRLVALSRAIRSLRNLRAPKHSAKVTTSSVAANRIRGRKAWRTRVKNQKAKMALVRSKAA